MRNINQERDLAYASLLARVSCIDRGQSKRITQHDVLAFGTVTNNLQFIHTDIHESRKRSPYKKLIAHAYFVLSLIPDLTNATYFSPVGSRCAPMILNYGFNRVRFLTGVPIGATVYADRELLKVRKRGRDALLVTQKVTVNIRGLLKPAVVATSLLYVLYR